MKMTSSIRDLTQGASFAPNRRSVLQGGAALATGLLLPAGMTSRAFAQTSKKGGHFKLAQRGGSTADVRDVRKWLNTTQYMGLSAVNEFLTEITNEGKVVPRLATEWDSPDGGKSWVFKLRKDVVFTNGKTVDADDVVASWNYHKGPESTSGAKPFADLATPRSDGKNTVIFELENASAVFPSITAYYMIPIFPAKDGELISAESDITAGPYKLESFDPGVRVIITRNENYWNKDVGHFDSSEILVMPDVNARNSALLTGGVHAVISPGFQTAKMMAASNKDVRVLNTPSKQYYDFAMRCDSAPFNDNNLRMALKHGIDRQAILDRVLAGYGTIANDQPISSVYPYFDPTIEQRAYDPDKAKYYLKQAGMDSFTMDVHCSDVVWQGAIESGTLYSEAARPAGINLNVVRVPNDSFWANTWKKVPFFTSIWYGKTTEDEVLSQTYSPDSSYNDAAWKNERFSKLHLEARKEFDEAKRAEMYSEIQHIIRDDGGHVIPAFVNWVDAVRNEVGTPEKIDGGYPADGYRALERWWFNS
jgi:peptide/nickel transport system substrate-binding protein